MMGGITLDTSDLNISLAALSLYLCVYGLVSYVSKHKLYLSEPLIALLFGIIVGPAVLGWVDPSLWRPEEDRLMGYKDHITLILTRITIGIQVFFAGVALPKKYLKTRFQSLIVLLLPVMSITWLVCGFLIYKIIPGLTFLEALLISACITPTDPVLANSITRGQYAEESVEPEIRDIIVAESGANDGLGYPFVFLPLFFIMARSSEPFDGPNRNTSGVIGRWIYATWLYQIALSVVLGFVIGWVARKAFRWCEERSMIDKDNAIAYSMGLSFFCLGFLGLIGSDDILCCFIAGNSFSWDGERRYATEEVGFHEVVDLLLNTAIFMYIGAIIPWSAYHDPSGTGMMPWHIVVLAICVMIFKRLPWVVAIHRLIPAISSLNEAIFLGWFGPMGVSAIFYVQIVLEHFPRESRGQVRLTIEPVVYFMVFTSVLVHGVTIPALKTVERCTTMARAQSKSNEKAETQSTGSVELDRTPRASIVVPRSAHDKPISLAASSVDLEAGQPNSGSYDHVGDSSSTVIERGPEPGRRLPV